METHKWLHRFLIFFYVLFFSFVLIIGINSIGFKRESPKIEDVVYLNNVSVCINGGPSQQLTLPYTIKGLDPCTPVTVEASFIPTADDSVYIRSKYTQADVFFDDTLVFQFGKRQNYPGFMISPATEIHAIETYGSGKEMRLQINYLSPSTDSSLQLTPPMVGSAKELILDRFVHSWFSWFCSIVLIAGGMSFLLISLYIVFIDHKGVLFVWLGLFALTSGLWFFGTNDFSITVFPDTTWLYLTSFINLSVCVIPLLHFIEIAVDFRHRLPLRICEAVLLCYSVIIVFLQMFGILQLHQSCKFFYFAIPIVLLLLASYTLYERIHFKNSQAARFSFPVEVLALGSLCQIAVDLNGIRNHFFPFFQMSVIAFLLMMGIAAGMTVKDSINLKKREQQLIHEKELFAIQTEEQRRSSLLLVQSEQELSRQRHDLRHHLTAISELSGDNEALQNYLSALLDKIPKAQERFCANPVVNAIISHYAVLCQKQGIRFTADTSVPDTDIPTVNSDLCVIFSNLLENASEACARMKQGEKYICLSSIFENGILTIAIDNSFDGSVQKKGSRFFSSKRDTFGIGLASAQSIAEKRHGGTDFHAEGNVFLSSVYLSLPEVPYTSFLSKL